MRSAALFALLLLALCGCDSHSSIPSSAPTMASTGCRRADDPSFSAQEHALITATSRHLEQGGKPLDAYYRLTKTADGYQLYVEFVTGYQGKEPVFLPGAFCVVLLNADGTIKKVLPGA